MLLVAAAPSFAGENRPTLRAAAPSSSHTLRQGVNFMNIRITINGQALAATLDDSPAGRDFAALLPLSLDLEDYAATEKIAQLPRKLVTTGAPAGITPVVGDITYYAPWGNLAIFHKGFGYANGLVKLGHIHADMDVLRGRGPMNARFEVANKH
jgi:hypothetical protein